MTSSNPNPHPKLRAVDVYPVVHGGRRSLLLRDPLRLSDGTVVIPHYLAPLLGLCDGTRDASALRAALAVRFGLPLTPGVIEQLLDALDRALLLDNERFAQAQEEALAAYRRAPFRQPTLAGQSYPAEANALRDLLNGYLDALEDVPHTVEGRGLVSPHIDYARGGPVYARVWKCATEMVRAAERVVLLGTDHHGGEGRVTLTRQNYATPFGVLPTHQETVEALAQELGEQEAFAEEFHHRGEHSIELAAVWLHHMREGQPCDLVPILCGSFARYVSGEAEPKHEATLNALVNVLQETARGRRVVVIASADLSHIGPAFGGQPVNLARRAQLQQQDEEIVERMCAGDAQGFLEAIRRVGDRNNVCGLPPIYLALRVLEPAQGEQVAYDRCPADEAKSSWVSICGLVWR